MNNVIDGCGNWWNMSPKHGCLAWDFRAIMGAVELKVPAAGNEFFIYILLCRSNTLFGICPQQLFEYVTWNTLVVLNNQSQRTL